MCFSLYVSSFLSVSLVTPRPREQRARGISAAKLPQFHLLTSYQQIYFHNSQTSGVTKTPLPLPWSVLGGEKEESLECGIDIV